MDSSFLLFFGLSSLQFSPVLFETHNTSITHWYKEPLGWLEELHIPETWILERYNDSTHLRDLDSPISIPWKDIAASPVLGTEASMSPTEAE